MSATRSTSSSRRHHWLFSARFLRWLRSEHVSISILAFITGVLAGTGAFLLKKMIAFVSTGLTSVLHSGGYNLLLLVIPLVGIVLTGIFTRYVLRRNIEHGVNQMMQGIASRHYNLSPSLTYSPLLASTLTLGFGGSAGSEGPIAYAGAAIGSNIARACRLSPKHTMILLGCGAAAGIAGIFKAPVGGAMFTLEVLAMEFTTASVLALMVAVIAAGLTTFALTGYTLDLAFPSMEIFHPNLLITVMILGVVCGLYSIWYNFIMDRMGRFFNRLSNPWVKNIISGAILSVLVFLFPALYGEGYPLMGKVLEGHFESLTAFGPFAGCGAEWLPLVLLGIVAVKALACVSSNSGGGVAGDFAPTLMAGCMLGLLYALLAKAWLGADIDSGNLAYYAMAGTMAGIIQAPTMAIFIVAEMSGGYTLLLPISIVAAISFLTVKACNRLSVYESRRRQAKAQLKHSEADNSRTPASVPEENREN